MGESLVELPAMEKKMDKSVKSGARLDVSVSFGRFENDALAWEKWSSFSPNKYLEEVGTLSTPGSVAQKKAYFEAHYKRIAAAKKAEESDPDSSVTPTREESYNEDHYVNLSATDTELGLSNGHNIMEENEQEDIVTVLANTTIADEANDDNARFAESVEQAVCMNGFMSVINSEEKEDAVDVLESKSSVIEEAKDELNVIIIDPESNISEEAMLEVEVPQKEPSVLVEKVSKKKIGTERPSIVKKKSSKLDTRSIAQKATPTKKETHVAGTTKRVVSPVVKPSQASTPRHSKPSSISTPMSYSVSSKKKVNGSPLTKSSNFLGKVSRRAPPTSLHMSLSLGPMKSSTAVPMTRKSLIMESMGDKDIVKRAFKSFQNHTNVSLGNEKSSTVKQVPSTASKPKVSTSLTPAKGNERLRKDTVKVATPRGQSGTRSSPVPSRPYKSSALKGTTAISPSVGLKSNERAEKRKEFLKNLEAKSIAREAENAQLSVKPKEEKESEIRKLRQSLNFKAKPMPSFYRGKLHPEKETTDGEMHS